MNVTMEGKRPVLGWPLPNVVESVGDLLRRDPIDLLEHDVRPDVDSPWIVLVATCGPPDRRVVLVHRGGDGDGRRECHPPRHEVEETVAGPHRIDQPPVAALPAPESGDPLHGR